MKQTVKSLTPQLFYINLFIACQVVTGHGDIRWTLRVLLPVYNCMSLLIVWRGRGSISSSYRKQYEWVDKHCLLDDQAWTSERQIILVDNTHVFLNCHCHLIESLFVKEMVFLLQSTLQMLWSHTTTLLSCTWFWITMSAFLTIRKRQQVQLNPRHPVHCNSHIVACFTSFFVLSK